MGSEGLPLVSIMMPVRNCVSTLSQAIESIRWQTVKDWELLVLDDGSTDETVAVACSFSDPRIKAVADGKHQGISIRLNQAIDLGRGKYLARMDGDDVAYPGRLERQVAYMEAHPEVDLIGAWMVVFGKDGAALGRRGRPLPNSWSAARWIFRSFPLPHPTFFGKTAWFRQNRYATWPTHFEDQQLLVRTFQTSHLEVLPEILQGYREEKLSVAKQWRYRRSFFRARRELAKSMGWTYTTALLAVQAAKLGAEVLAITMGLHRVALRNRAGSLSPAEIQEWKLLWNALNRTEPVTIVGTQT